MSDMFDMMLILRIKSINFWVEKEVVHIKDNVVIEHDIVEAIEIRCSTI